MHWPQITVIILMTISLACSLKDHGKVKTETENSWNMLVSVMLYSWLMWRGGFFG